MNCMNLNPGFPLSNCALTVRFIEWESRLTIFVLALLTLVNVGISGEALGWSCFALGVASFIAKCSLFPLGWDRTCLLDGLFLLSTIVVSLLGADLISTPALAWTLMGLNAFGALGGVYILPQSKECCCPKDWREGGSLDNYSEV